MVSYVQMLVPYINTVDNITRGISIRFVYEKYSSYYYLITNETHTSVPYCLCITSKLFTDEDIIFLSLKTRRYWVANIAKKLTILLMCLVTLFLFFFHFHVSKMCTSKDTRKEQTIPEGQEVISSNLLLFTLGFFLNDFQ